jgi:phosphoglycolate phosphatase
MDLVIFDLDGTLIDSKLDLAHAVNATRRHMELPELPHDLIATYVGNGAPVLLRRSLGPEASDADVQRGLEFFLSYYHDHKLDYTVLYPGVREALDQLFEDNVKLAVLTNKPVKISKAILEGLGVASHFFQVYGGNSFDQKKPDPIGIHALMSEAGVPPRQTMMVGDSAVDVRTARNAGVACCGVLFGFQPETFNGDPPDFTVEHMEELTRRILADRSARAGH